MYHYKECGLDNVWLGNGYKEYDTPYGKGVAVEQADELLQAIALQLVQKPALLTGKELRFLRVQMRLSQPELGAMHNVSGQMVSLWERKSTLPLVNDRWVRIQYLGHSKSYELMQDIVKDLMTAGGPGETCITVQRKSGAWKSKAKPVDCTTEEAVTA